jgi:hypothetical protein
MIAMHRYMGFVALVIMLAILVLILSTRRSLNSPALGYNYRAMFQSLLIVALVFLLVGALAACSPAPPKLKPLEDVVLVPPPSDKVSVPDETLKPCGKIPRLEERPYAEGEVLTYMQSNVTVQSDCRKRHGDATNTIKRAFNITASP